MTLVRAGGGHFAACIKGFGPCFKNRSAHASTSVLSTALPPSCQTPNSVSSTRLSRRRSMLACVLDIRDKICRIHSLSARSSLATSWNCFNISSGGGFDRFVGGGTGDETAGDETRCGTGNSCLSTGAGLAAFAGAPVEGLEPLALADSSAEACPWIRCGSGQTCPWPVEALGPLGSAHNDTDARPWIRCGSGQTCPWPVEALGPLGSAHNDTDARPWIRCGSGQTCPWPAEGLDPLGAAHNDTDARPWIRCGSGQTCPWPAEGLDPLGAADNGQVCT